MRHVLFTLTILSLFPLSIHAHDTNIQDTLREVVVTGTPITVHKDYVPLSVSIVTREAIEASGESNILPVLNGRVPGLFVTERGITGFGVSGGAAGQISIRGVGSAPTTGVLMLIDGHPQLMGLFGHPLADSYVASDIERVEVIRGPGSLLYGTNAMGGVINLITRKNPQEGWKGNARVAIGIHSTRKLSAAASYGAGPFSLYASINHDATEGHRPNAPFKLTNGYLKLGYAFSPTLRIKADASLATFTAQDPGPDTLGAAAGTEMDIQRGYWALSVEKEAKKHQFSGKVFHNFGEHRISDGFHSTDNHLGLQLQETLNLFKGNTLSLGVDGNQYGGKASNHLNGPGRLIDTTVTDAGLFAFVRQSLLDKVELNAGLRWQHHSVWGDRWIPSAGIAWKPWLKSTLKASYGQGFRSPSIRELFLWNHNVDLMPESVTNYELGWAQLLPWWKGHLEMTAFWLTGDNLIVTVPMQGLRNAGALDNKGLESSLSFSPTPALTTEFTYTYQHLTNPVYATPRHQLFFGASYRFKAFVLAGNVRHIDHLNTLANPLLPPHFERYTLLNANVNWQLRPYLTLFLHGHNLLNQHYETNRYYTMPGTTFMTGFKLAF